MKNYSDYWSIVMNPKTKLNWKEDDLPQTFAYGLKEITNLDDLNQIVDWKNNSFYKSISRSSSSN